MIKIPASQTFQQKKLHLTQMEMKLFQSVHSLELDELVDAGAALGHGFDEAAPDVEDDDARMVAVLECFFKGLGEFVLGGDGLCLDAEALGVLDVVHRVVEFTGDVALLVHDFLKLADHAEAPVVDDQGDDRQLQARDRVELVARHLDAAVAGHLDDAPVRAVVELCAHGGRQAEAHRAETAGGQPRARLFDAQVKRRPHLMLSDIRRKGIRLALRALHDLMHRPGDGQAVLVIVVGVRLLPLVNLLPPVRQGGIRLVLHEQRKDGLHIAGEAERVAHVLVDLSGIDVDVDELRVLRVLVEVARLAVAKAAADGDDEVGRGNRVIRGLLAVHAGKAERLRMGARYRAEPHERVDDRQVVLLDEGDDFLRRAGRDDATADNRHGPLGLDNLVGRLCRADQEVGIRFPVMLGLHGLRLVVDIREEEVARHIDEHGTGPAMARQSKGLAHGRHELVGMLDLEIVLRDRHRNVEDVRLLERIAPQERSVDLSRDGDDRHGVHEGRRKARDEICRAGARRRDADADLARSARVAVGCVRGILFVCHEDFPDVRVLIKCIVKRQDHAARITKNRVDSLFLETESDCLRSLHLASPFCRLCRRSAVSDALADDLRDLFRIGLLEAFLPEVRRAVTVGQRLVDCRLDCLGRLFLMQRIAQQHGCREDRAHRVGDSLAGDVRRTAVNRLVEARARADGGRRHHADGAADDGRLVGEDVAEEVARDDDIELRRTDGQLHRAVVDVEVVELNVRIRLCDLGHRAAPEARRREDIGLVDRRDLAAAQLGRLEGELRDAVDLRNGVVLEVPGALGAVVLLRLALVTEVDAADELAHDDEVDALDELRLQRGVLDECIGYFDRAQVGVESEVLAQAEDGLLGAQRRVDVVPLVAADGAEEDAVGHLAGLDRVIRQRRAELVVGRAAGVFVGVGEPEAELLIDLLEDFYRRIRDFLADTIARYHCDLI